MNGVNSILANHDGSLQAIVGLRTNSTREQILWVYDHFFSDLQIGEIVGISMQQGDHDAETVPGTRIFTYKDSLISCMAPGISADANATMFFGGAGVHLIGSEQEMRKLVEIMLFPTVSLVSPILSAKIYSNCHPYLNAALLHFTVGDIK